MDFLEYFSDKAITKILAALRVRAASHRHDYQFFWSRFELDARSSPEKLVKSDVAGMLPPRRAWKRPPAIERIGKAPSDIALDSIVRVAIGCMTAGTLQDYPWGRKLTRFTRRVRREVQKENQAFAPPYIHLIRKTKGRIKIQSPENQRTAYRCLSTFKNLQDRVIIGCTARYIRDLVDPSLMPCSYGFRKDGKQFSFKRAVTDLRDYRRRHQGTPLYVAECDIQKFFDVVNHEMVLAAYDSFMQRLEHLSPDPRARGVLSAYLDSYSFPRCLEESSDPEIVARKEYVERVPNEILRKLYPGTDEDELSLGLPQGGALSPLLANLVMDAADRAVLSTDDPELFYARYCDDMIIVHPDKKACQRALNRYVDAMKLLRLPIHKIVRRVTYGEHFYDCKSKGPYLWADVQAGGTGSPWVSFLGHQIRYDGIVRIRKETLRKHGEKLETEAIRLKRAVKASKKRFRAGHTPEDVLEAFELRLISSGVGRIDNRPDDKTTRSWLSAFKGLLSEGPIAEAQLKGLDAMREKTFKTAAKILFNADETPHGVTRKRRMNGPDAKGRARGQTFYGAPYSYYGVFKGLARPNKRCEEDGATTAGGVTYGEL